MVQKLNYNILTDQCLIIEYYCGKYNVDELIAFKQRVAQDKNYNPNFNIIHDFRDMEFLLTPKEVSKYVKMLHDHNKYVGTRKSVMLTATPNQVVASIGFKLLKRDLPISVKVCSTEEIAFAFIDINKNTQNTVKNILDKLKEL